MDICNNFLNTVTSNIISQLHYFSSNEAIKHRAHKFTKLRRNERINLLFTKNRRRWKLFILQRENRLSPTGSPKEHSKSGTPRTIITTLLLSEPHKGRLQVFLNVRTLPYFGDKINLWSRVCKANPHSWSFYAPWECSLPFLNKCLFPVKIVSIKAELS